MRITPRAKRLLAGLLSALVVVAVFGFALPRVASYHAVWGTLQAATLPWLGLVAVTVLVSQVTTWMMISAVIPSLRLRRAAAVNLGSSAVANTVPGGGAVAMGMSWAMLGDWGVGTGEYVRYTLVSGLWNVFARLGLPVAALLALAVTGRASGGFQVAAYAGAGVLLLIVAGFRAILRNERFALLAGRVLTAVLRPACRLIRRPPPERIGGMVLDFRSGAAGLLAERGVRITVTTVASHLSLWLVLLACLHATGLGQGQVPWQASLAAFSFARLLSVLPVTPGGVGLVEAGLTGTLIAGLTPAGAAQVTAAVLLFRAVTYLLPLPFGAAAYLWWRHSSRGRRETARSARRD